ncbi:zinc/cadmium resistance protein [Cephus cinctus]|uniref:Zinc/cadmium resistance protein n=1 Tax=Cephus cinctus TaxID=211228 RepID=A0AAJ7CAN3_CEPCN|nr:zinc/cadmium resistance protein [Cephus cinctus]XP_024946001.1 zinc/cadmium resistance protein [Cephus cinctus]
MAVKKWFRSLQPVQLYVVLFFTTAFFVVELVASHLTHALTLLLNAYHMLCNIVALVGCIASIKYEQRDRYQLESNSCSSQGNSSTSINDESKETSVSLPRRPTPSKSDRRMKNTFGWARIDIVIILVCCVLHASFCFSLVVEALQTLVHIDHTDAIHHVVPVFCIGAAGILLNVFCYILIGGYTFNQGVFLHVTKHGNVVFKKNVSSQPAKDGEQQLSGHSRWSPLALPRSQGFREMCRDVLGCFFVTLVAVLVYFTDGDIAKYFDPVLAIISALCLFMLSYPYMRESGYILLQTIPNHMNIDALKRELLMAFPGIVNVHDFHVWQLTGQKIVSTVHIIFMDPTVYASITDQVTNFFNEMGITQVTIQPEFDKMKPKIGKLECLIPCQSGRCSSPQCCTGEQEEENSSTVHPPTFVPCINKKFDKKEILPSPDLDLKKFTVGEKAPEVKELKVPELSEENRLSTSSSCSIINELISSTQEEEEPINVPKNST